MSVARRLRGLCVTSLSCETELCATSLSCKTEVRVVFEGADRLDFGVQVDRRLRGLCATSLSCETEVRVVFEGAECYK
ncbi:hypothetical protein B484DRAFT_393210 [Ochromonadaceae sp. CCMP2298]|nr:hypothetical protein B484DRAFT_393210 [Ochromonadaceae sp. CCMP2298]